MAWKCPQCRQTNESTLKKCACGYAYYDVLGLKEDAPAQSVEQAYTYLTKVWKMPSGVHNSPSGSKLDERVKKINDAYSVFRQITKGTTIQAGSGNTVKIAVGAVAALVVALVAIFFFSSNQKAAQPIVPSVSPDSQMATPEKSVVALPSQPVAEQPLPERKNDVPDMNADKTPEWAIESVKKSHLLDRFSTADTLVNKWMKENADKLKPIGWIAKKVDEQVYLVTFTATDGVTQGGFYFDISAETGEIRNIANHPDLQKKYGIKGN